MGWGLGLHTVPGNRLRAFAQISVHGQRLSTPPTPQDTQRVLKPITLLPACVPGPGGVARSSLLRG